MYYGAYRVVISDGHFQLRNTRPSRLNWQRTNNVNFRRIWARDLLRDYGYSIFANITVKSAKTVRHFRGEGSF